MSRLLILMLCLTLSGCQLTTLGLNRLGSSLRWVERTGRPAN